MGFDERRIIVLDALQARNVSDGPQGRATHLADAFGNRVCHGVDLIGLLIASDANIPFASEQYYGSFPLFRTVGQLFAEPGDPVNLAQGFASSGKAVLLQEGIGDQTIPNSCSEALAGSMGLTVVTAPVSGQAPLQALYRLDPSKYGQPASYNGHNIFWDISAARTQVQGFLGSGGTQIPVE